MENNKEIKHFIKLFFNFAKEKLNISSCPRVILVYDDQNAKDFFGKTGSYDPKTRTIHTNSSLQQKDTRNDSPRD